MAILVILRTEPSLLGTRYSVHGTRINHQSL